MQHKGIPASVNDSRKCKINNDKVYYKFEVSPDYTSNYTYTWFDALESMKREIDKRDFDIAIIGCGAYGFPLAAYVKSIGKKAVHLGGATQMLFGIKSKSWEDEPKFHYLINEYWVSPKETERPANYKLVEGGRYW